MAVFSVEGLLAAELVFDFPAVTACFVADVKIRVVFVHAVGDAVFPLIVFTFQLTLVSVVAVGGRHGGCKFDEMRAAVKEGDREGRT